MNIYISGTVEYKSLHFNKAIFLILDKALYVKLPYIQNVYALNNQAATLRKQIFVAAFPISVLRHY